MTGILTPDSTTDPPCILSLSGEVLQVEGLENTSTVAEVRALTAAALGCSASQIKLVQSRDGEDVSAGLVSDEQKLEELPCKQFVAMRQLLDPSLVKLTSKVEAACTRWTLSYGDTVIWSQEDRKCYHFVEGWQGCAYVAELSEDKMVLTVTCGSVKMHSGRMSGKHATKKDLNVEDLVTPLALAIGAKVSQHADLHTRGSFESAKRIGKEVQEACDRILGPEHPNSLVSKHNLVLTLMALGDLQGARQLHEEVLEAHDRTLGPENPKSVAYKQWVASTLMHHGDLQGAKKLHEEVLEARDRTLGPEHPFYAYAEACNR